MDQNPVGASDGRLLSAPKIFAAVVGIIGIALLAFPDPIRKLVDNFGPINPLGSGAHLAIENQKGLTSEPLPLGISVADSSGGETVIVSGMPEGTELSLGTALVSGSWAVPVADLDKTFVGAPTGFVGAVTAKVILNSPTGTPQDTRNIRFEWNNPESYSAPPAGQTETTWRSTPHTSGRAEPTPTPGPIPSPAVSDTAEPFIGPLRADPSPAVAAPAAANCLASVGYAVRAAISLRHRQAAHSHRSCEGGALWHLGQRRERGRASRHWRARNHTRV